VVSAECASERILKSRSIFDALMIKAWSFTFCTIRYRSDILLFHFTVYITALDIKLSLLWCAHRFWWWDVLSL